MWRAASFGLVLLAGPVAAHEGHDHGPPAATPAPGIEVPRTSAESTDFELVATLEHGELRVYLDDFASNAPIEDASLEVESGAYRAQAEHLGQGIYRVHGGPLAAPGRHELIFTVRTQAASDLLLGTLEIPEADGAARVKQPATPAWYESAPVLQGVSAVLVICVLALLLWRDRRAGTAAVVLAGLTFLAHPGTPLAHEGHDHGEPSPATGVPSNAPRRLADGSLFVPKPAQRLLGLRTARAKPGEWPDTFTLAGHVVADPNASALVQAPLRGRIELPEGGLPQLGARVREGQVLAYLAPILDAVDQTTLQADLAQLEGRILILTRNLERLRQLGANAPRQDLEQTDAELSSLMTRRKAITDSFVARLPLTAPVAGVLALRNAFPGQIVAGGDTLFTLVDPQRLWVEALLYDTDHATHFVTASGRTADGQELVLTPLGAGYELRGHALPIQFRIEPHQADPAAPHLVVRQPVTVVARMHHGSTGLRIPTRAVQRGPDGTNQVWVHVRPEHYRPQRVQVRDLGGGHSVVTQGLAAGDRVVADGASLLAQVR